MRRAPLALALVAAVLALWPRTLGVLRPRPVLITGLRDALISREGADLETIHRRADAPEGTCGWCHLEQRPGAARAMLNDPNRWLASAGAGSAAATPGVTTSICLSCHDGSVAKAVPHTLPGQRDPAIEPGGANHPVGVDYQSAVMSRPAQYHDAAARPEISLEGGKVGCTSCHQGHARNGRVEGPGLRTNVCMSCHDL